MDVNSTLTKLEAPTPVHALRAGAESAPDERSLGFLTDGEGDAEWLSRAELDRRARQMATALLNVAEPGTRVVLVHRPGLDFTAAFLGTLYAGMVAVPAYPPDPARLERTLPRFARIVGHSGAEVLAGDPELVEAGKVAIELVPELRECTLLGMPEADAPADADLRLPSPDDVALLQYTSGSTRHPRGVVIRHRNIMANMAVIHARVGLGSGDVSGFWLPPFHDMGLIASLYSLVMGVPTVSMSPVAFIRRPRRWLEMVSDYRVSYSGGPNFGFELCVRKVLAEARAGLDLSSWRVAFNGAEPIKADTLRRFQQAFAPSGLPEHPWMPCYGLAEITVGATGHMGGDPLVVGRFSREGLEANELRPDPAGVELVGSGAMKDQLTNEVRVVDPETSSVRPDGGIGEIWLRGPSVSDGYHDDAEATAATFGASLDGHGTGWLRTGDRGAVKDGELFVTGRARDLLIVHGRNLEPHDVEACAQESHRALRPAGGAAFQLGSRVVIVQEAVIRGGLRPEDLVANMRRRVADELGLQFDDVVLIPPRTLPKTSSGKVQRSKTARLFASGKLEVLVHDTAPEAPAELGSVVAGEGASWSADQVLTWVRARVAARLGVEPEEVPVDVRLRGLGLDSVALVEVADEVGALVDCPIDTDVLIRDPTLQDWVSELIP